MTAVANLLSRMVDIVLPPRCASCGDITHSDAGFCVPCWSQLHFIGPPWCDSCGIPLPFAIPGGQQCGACMASPPHHDGIRAVTAYCDISSQIALKLKYAGKVGLADMIAGQMHRHLAGLPTESILTPVPLHWTRLWGRSFNQSALITNALSEKSGMATIPDLLTRTKRTELLRGKNARARINEVKQAFAVSSKHAQVVKDAHILLIDDVYTSGATSDACVKALKQAGAASVIILCWARVLKDEQLSGGVSVPDMA